MDLRDHALADLAGSVARKELSARELLDITVAAVEANELPLNAWAAIDVEGAGAQAAVIDERLARGEDVGPLAGIPIGVKDLEDAAGFRTTYGSTLHTEDPVAERDSVLVARLRAAGCVVLGKTTTPEFGWQGDTTSPAFGPTRNPWGTDRSPGGSSGGSGAALAAGMVPLATGSDGGGSIRIPASLCGLAGLKTTTGRVPIGGASAPGSGVLTVKGPMARTARDNAYALDVCVGPDPTDPFSLPYTSDAGSWFAALGEPGSLPAPVRVMWAPAPGFAVDAEVAAVVGSAIDRIADAGVVVDEVDRLFSGEPLADWFTIWCVVANRRQGHLRGTPDWEQIDLGLREQMDHAHLNLDTVAFARALDSTHAHNAELAAHFETAPIVLLPTVAGQTASVGEQGRVDGDATIFWAPFTGAANLLRNPAGSIPVGFTGDGMPVGLQVLGRHHDDLGVLRTMAWIEDLLGLSMRAPLG